jgi:hypothetical protein
MHQEFLQYLSSMGVAVSPNVTTGNGMDFLIGRVSYTFGLTGPCLRWVCCVGSQARLLLSELRLYNSCARRQGELATPGIC